MARFTRRNFLKLSGSGAVAAKTGGMAAILASGRAPAFAQSSAVHWLRWVDFVPASDEVMRKEIVPECQKALGMTLKFETINANDIQARTTAAIQSGSGPDVICGVNNWPQLYAESVVDVSDLAEEIGKAQEGFYTVSRAVANDGKKLKAKGRPIGQTLGHTFGDAPTYAYPYLWSWGGKEVEADGKTVVLDSKATVDSVKFMTGFWKDAHDEGGLAWDDTNNNRAFLSQTISATLNGASIYIESLRNPDTYITEKNAQLKTDILHAALPKGPAGQFSM